MGLGAVVARFLARQDYDLIVTAGHEAPCFAPRNRWPRREGTLRPCPET